MSNVRLNIITCMVFFFVVATYSMVLLTPHGVDAAAGTNSIKPANTGYFDSADEVIWTNIVNAVVSGDILKKTKGCGGCSDAGAVSQQSIASGDGSVEFTAIETTRTRVVGLGKKSDVIGGKVDFAIQLTNGGNAEVRESGAYKADVRYRTGDIFKIAIEQNRVKYYKNGDLYYTSSKTLFYPLYVVASLFDLNSTVSNARISSGSTTANTPAIEITDVSTEMRAENKVRITWKTNIPGTTQVEYGTSTSYGRFTTLKPTLTTSHGVTLSRLSPGTRYHYRAISTDENKNTVKSNDYSFDTPMPGDTNPPVISGVNVTNLKDTSAMINWVTNEDCSSIVEYGVTNSYGGVESSNVLVSTHSMPLYKLTPDKSYHFRVRSQDAAGNVSVSPDYSFKTLPSGSNPVISISNIGVTNLTPNSATIKWTTNIDCNSVVDYGLSNTYGQTVSKDVLTTSHNLVLNGLTEKTRYYYRVISKDSSGNQAGIGDLFFVTPGATPAGVITDSKIYPAPAPPALPSAGEKFVDPTFGSTIMRLTDSSDGKDNYNHYSYWPSFNMNSTYVIATSGSTTYLYDFDPDNFRVSNKRPLLRNLPSGVSPYTEDAIWSNIDPNIIYFHDGMRIWSYDVSSTTLNLIKDFRGSLPQSNLWQMSKSEDDNVFAFTRKDSNFKVAGYIAWSRNNDVLTRKDRNTIDEVQVDKTGRFVLVKTGQSGRGAIEGQVLDLVTGSIENLTDDGPDYNPGHSDMGRGYVIGHDNWQNRVLRRNLATPHVFQTVFQWQDWSQSEHYSLLAENEEWMLISTYGSSSNQGPFHNEIFQLATDGSKRVRRLAHHQSVVRDYWDSPRANISRDGRFVVFTSNWGSRGQRDVFILKVPGY